MVIEKIFRVILPIFIMSSVVGQIQKVKWRDLTNCTYNSSTNTISKTGASVAWDAGALSYNRLESGEPGSVYFTVPAVGILQQRQVGLAKYNIGVTLSDVDFCIRQANNQLRIIESGTTVFTASSYIQANDVLMIERIGSSVVYSRIRSGVKTTAYTSTATINPNDVLYADCGFYRSGSFSQLVDVMCDFGYINISKDITNIDFENGKCFGAIDISIDSAVLPVTYSWDNGEITEDILGLIQGSYTLTVTDALGGEEVMEANVYYDVKWDNIVSLTYNSTANTLTATSGNGWIHGALSKSKLNSLQDGIVGIKIPAMGANEHQMIGLSTYNTGASYTTILYALYHTGSGVNIFENGSLVYQTTPSYGVSEIGDFYYVERTGSNIYYKRERNGETTLLYTSTASVNPYDELYADGAIWWNGKTISQIYASFGKGCISDNSFVVPSKLLTGTMYLPKNNELKVQVPENYTTNLSDCEISITDELTTTDFSPTSMPIKVQGKNKYVVDLTATVNSLSSGIYVMHFINDKGDKLYLKFKV